MVNKYNLTGHTNTSSTTRSSVSFFLLRGKCNSEGGVCFELQGKSI